MTLSISQSVAQANEPRWFMGQLVNILVSNEFTLGQFSLIEMTMKPGTELLMHRHER